jgi:type II secretory pathway component PulF
VGAGLPLVGALAALSEQTENVALKRIVVEVREDVEQGSSFATSLGKFPKAFPRLYVNMVAAGEASGTLDTVLSNLADYLESQLSLRRQINSALMYPALMLFICSAVIIGMFVFVIPRIVEIFQKQGAVLPLPTQAMIAISHFMIGYWWLILALVTGAIIGVKTHYADPKGRDRIDRILLKLPLYGSIYTKIATARVARTLSTLLSSGVNLLIGLDITRNIVNNVHITKAIEDARDGVREGRSLAKELSKSGIFPSMLGQMIAVGERSGELETMLGKASVAYENEVDATLSGLTSLLEPLLMIVVGGIVLVIVISVLLPMVDLISVVQQG